MSPDLMEPEPAPGTETVLRYLASRRARIAAACESLAAARGEESLSRIAEFCLRGKMIRGCLVFLGAEAVLGPDAAKGREGAALARLALAMELFQGGLLAHDDIMDRDEIRRGAPTLHTLYATEAKAEGADDALHVGEALGICLGDVCYFEGFAELAAALAGRPRAAEAQALCTSILSEVALAQMKDVRWGATAAEPSEEEILSMYRSKTARYSFSLPLAAGAIFAEAEAGPGSSSLADRLIRLGERLGLLFQIRDDELGLFGDEGAIGKGRGSDLREGKKTLFRSRLLAAAPCAELPRLRALFGGSVLGDAALGDGSAVRDEDIAYIGGLAEELGVSRSIRELSKKAEQEARDILRAMPTLRPEAGDVLEGLVEYVTGRDR
jgi:geranylgeranyl diphosphate synthase, type I